MFREWFSKRKNLQSSIFMVILWINFGSIVVLSLFNYQVFHRMNNKVYRESFLSYNQRVTDLAFENIDKQIMQSVFRIWKLNFSISKEDSAMFLPQNESISQSSENTLALTEDMRELQRTYPYVAGMDIYYEATGTIVTGFDTVHTSSDKEAVKRYIPWYDAYVKQGRKSGFVLESDGVYLMDTPVITYIRSISRPKWEGKDIVLAFHILPSSFAEYIDVEGGNLTIVGNDNQILYTTEHEDVSLYKDKDLTTLRNENTPLFWESSDEPVTIFRKSASTSGLMYLYSIRDSIFYKNYKITSNMFLINFLISIGFNILVLALISFYNYRTYRKRVLSVSKNAGIDIGVSNQSFDGSLTTLTKEITILHETVNSSKGLLFQNAVRSVILNRKTEGDYETLNPYLTNDSVCTFFLGVPDKDTEYISVEELQEKFPPEKRRYNVLFTMIEKNGLVAILNFDRKCAKQDIADFREDIEQYWEDYIICGKIFSTQKDGLKNSYKSTLEVFRYRYIFPEQKELSYENINLEECKESGSHLKLFEAMEKDIKNENLLDFKIHMEFLTTSFKNGNYGLDYCMSTLRDLVTWMYQVIQYNQLDMWVMFGYDIREYYRQIPDIDIFCVWMNGLCEITLKNTRQRKKDIDPDVQTQIVKMIEEHLEDDISLDYIADQLHIRPDVASRLFRQIMGNSYTEYIREKKLNRAIQLLEQDYTVKDIAQKLGYSSAQYFIKVFKEEHGITPYQYKKGKSSQP